MTDKQSQQLEGPVVQEAEPKVQRPRLYKVLLLNDDYTPMEFVVVLIERVFHKNREEATQIMLHVHQKGWEFAGYLPGKWPRPRSGRCWGLPRKGCIRCSAPWNRNESCMS